jgi:hypothetical protein
MRGEVKNLLAVTDAGLDSIFGFMAVSPAHRR